MVTFHVLTDIGEPLLWIVRDRSDHSTAELAYDVLPDGTDAHGLRLFQARLDHQIHEPVHVRVHDKSWQRQDPYEHRKTLVRTVAYRFRKRYWVVEGTSRMLVRDPFEQALDHVRIHLVTARKYRGGRLFLWSPGGPSRFVDAAGTTEQGPYFDVALSGRDRHLFLFKFVSAAGAFEPDYANRLWTAADGAEVWVHSHSTSVSRERLRLRAVAIRLYDFGAPGSPLLHLWQEDSDFVTDLAGTREANGWVRFEARIYSDCTYRFLFQNAAQRPVWEHEQAKRNLSLRAGGEIWTHDSAGNARRLGEQGVWTLEGDHELYGAEPPKAQRMTIRLASARDPRAGLSDATGLDVWINRARKPLYTNLPPTADGSFAFDTYGGVVTSFRFRAGDAYERVERHFLKVRAGDAPIERYVVLGRADPLAREPRADLFAEPAFPLERPGAWLADGHVRFAVHCPSAASVEIIGEWTGWEARPVELQSTPDGTYFWGQVPISNVTTQLGRESVHGTLYKLRLNQVRLVQDPAADWVENSDPERASKLVDHDRYVWRSSAWQRPAWDYLVFYQLHPSRFARRDGTAGLDAITRELTAPDGYLRNVNATALLLMPTCEFAGDVGWGYNPSFFYSVESAYGGPDALKRLVDACHESGRAVFLDVVFNHAGTSDNALWSVASESYFDGDTEWGAMINFDHPQVIHFFEQNLVHFLRHYRVDGFRFDFTRVIRYGGTWSSHVRQPGSGGGWEFMHKLRRAVHAVDARCLFMAENLPNEWDLTRYGGPMDSQWCDEFHDRIVEAARGWPVLGRLADALCVTHTSCNQWYEATNYAESHDEVGNEPNRISSMHVGGIGQGLRRNKVAAAATLLSRGLPLWFMGAEAGEWRQFKQGDSFPLDLDFYEGDPSARHLLRWWNALCLLRVGNSRIQGPAPLRVHYVDPGLLALSRGEGGDFFAVLNFGHWSGWRSLAELNLPDGDYKELLNSTWGDYRVDAEGEDEHSNGGWDAHLDRSRWLNVPDYGVVLLEKR